MEFKIELKGFKLYERMSEETNCFICDVHINGKKVGFFKNDGQGGDSYFQHTDNKHLPLINEVENYYKQQPPIKIESFRKGEFFEIPSNLSNHLDGMVDKLVDEHYKKKEQQQYKKLFNKGLVIIDTDGQTKTYSFKKFNFVDVKTNPRLKELFRKERDNFIKQGITILNDNLHLLD